MLLAAMFVAFIVQIVFRYLFNFPIGWTSELTVITWLWLVLWGAAFVVTEAEEIRFDLIYSAVGARTRRIMAIVTAVALLMLYGMSLPAVVDYVTFMKVQSTAYLKIRFDWLFSIYVIFAVAVLVRYAWILWWALAAAAPAPSTRPRRAPACDPDAPPPPAPPCRPAAPARRPTPPAGGSAAPASRTRIRPARGALGHLRRASPSLPLRRPSPPGRRRAPGTTPQPPPAFILA